MLDETISPSSQVLKTFLVGDVIDKGAAVCSAVECITQGLKLLLTSSVPDLKSDYLVVNGNFLLGEVCSDGGL